MALLVTTCSPAAPYHTLTPFANPPGRAIPWAPPALGSWRRCAPHARCPALAPGQVDGQIRGMKRRLRELEEMVVDAWPAPETDEQSGWLLRCSGGPSHRGNSVATLVSEGDLPLRERIGHVERWYQERGRAAMFQVGPCAEPQELDQALADAGYRKESESALAVAAPSEVLTRTERTLATRIDGKASDAWLEIAVGASRFAGTQPVFQGFLRRLGSRARYVTAYDTDGVPAACCLAIASEERLGVYAMITLPEARKRGAARSLLNTLAESAAREHVRELYLLVETQNLVARSLYARCGFQDVYKYHYRTR